MWWKIAILALLLVITSVTLIFNIGYLIFKRNTNREVVELFNGVNVKRSEIITKEDIIDLPQPVQRYLRYTGIIGKEKITTVRLKQKGYFRQEGNPWMQFTAEQYYTTDPPAFIWIANMKIFPPVSVKGRDLYREGIGNMLIELPPFITFANARGEEINQGALVRYLNEIMWFPSAYCDENIQWESIDSNSAKATMVYKGVTASAILYFNDEGQLVNFIAPRYMTKEGKYFLETWATPMGEYREIKGLRLPVKGEGVWKLESGDFSYIKLELTDIEYNIADIY